jgi:flagellar biosynthetic protein FlhB
MSEEETQDKENKTEEPSQKKLEEALEKGQVIQSKEVTNAFVLFVLTNMVIWILPMIFKSSTMNLKLLIEHSGEIRIDQGQVWNVTYSSITKAFLSLSPLFIMVITAVIFAAFVQQGQISFSANSIEPKLSKISIFKGIGRIFSTNNFVEFLKSIAKVTLVGYFCT